MEYIYDPILQLKEVLWYIISSSKLINNQLSQMRFYEK